MKIVSKIGERQKGILDYLSWILMVVVLIFTANVMIMNVRGKAVSVFGYSILKVVTGSMEPTIMTGEYIIVKDADPNTLKEGDIITFYAKIPQIRGLLCTHRIVGFNEDGSIMTKGDANNVEDDIAVQKDEVLGKYVCKARFFSMIGSFADKKKLLLVVVIIPILAISFYEMRTLGKLWKSLREDDEETPEKDKKEAEIDRIKKEAIEEYIKQRNESNNEQGKEEQETE